MYIIHPLIFKLIVSRNINRFDKIQFTRFERVEKF